MRLTFKLTAILFLLTVVLLAADSFFTIKHTVRIFESDAKEDLQLLGTVLSTAVVESWKTKGRERALELIDDINRGDNTRNIAWIDVSSFSQSPQLNLLQENERALVIVGGETLVHSGDAGEQSMALYKPVMIAGRLEGVVELRESLKPLEDIISDRIRGDVVLTTLLALLGGALMFFVGTFFVGRPIESLVAMTRRIGSGMPGEPVSYRGGDEIAVLVNEVNLMGERLEASRKRAEDESNQKIQALERLQHSDRLAVAGKLASAIAHEIGTPLNVVGGRAEFIASGELAPSEMISNGQVIRKEVERIRALVRQFLDFSRRRAPVRQLIDLNSILRSVCDLLSPLASKKSTDLELRFGASRCELFVDPVQIQQAITNVIINAVQAMKDKGKVVVSTSLGAFDPHRRPNAGRCVTISIEDNAGGIPDEKLPFIFEPFFTTKEAGEGSGLGLSIAKEIIADHDGEITVRTSDGQGTVFTIILPVGIGYVG